MAGSLRLAVSFSSLCFVGETLAK